MSARRRNRRRRMAAAADRRSVVDGHDNHQTQVHPRYQARRANRNRKLQTGSDDDFLYFYSGEVVGSFDGSNYFATWDGNFFAIGDSIGGYIDLYVFDYGEGLREFPVMYFPASKPVTVDDVAGMLTYADAEAAGGSHGYVSFSENNMANGRISTGLGLYTVSATGDTFSEVPRARGGQIVPVNFADAFEDGEEYSYYIGGYYGENIIEWGTNSVIEINSIRGIDYKNEQLGESFTLDAVATDDDTGTSTTVLFELDDDGTIIDNSTFTEEGTGSTGGGGTGGGGGGDGGSGALHLRATLAISFAGLLTALC